MTDAKMKIMIAATKIRMQQGEGLEDILKSYPKLTEDDKNAIRNAVAGNEESTT